MSQPNYGLDKIQKHLKTPMSTSTQWDLKDNLTNFNSRNPGFSDVADRIFQLNNNQEYFLCIKFMLKLS